MRKTFQAYKSVQTPNFSQQQRDQNSPIRLIPSRAAARHFPASEINEMLLAKGIESVTTKWVANIVFTSKKDGSLRFCVDFRKLSTVLIPSTYLLYRMDEGIDSCGESTVLLTLGASSQY